MYRHQGATYSSFMSIYEHPPQGLSPVFQVLTVRSGSRGDGGHVSMYLEKPYPASPGCFVTWMIEMTALPDNPKPIINIRPVQQMNAQGVFNCDRLDERRGPFELLQTHHTCYKLREDQSAAVLTAANRFDRKNNEGRYIYHRDGGIKARLATKPGTRGVNCADLVIKILREAGIASLGYKYRSAPFRVADPS